MRTTKTMKNIQRDNNFDHYIDVSGVSPVTLEMINTKLDDMRSKYNFWLWFFLIVNVIDVLLLIFKSK